VKQAAGAPQTALWQKGGMVKDNPPIVGTGIATFDPTGKYIDVSGQSHAALFLSMDANGVQVVDQYEGKPGGKRTIRFNPNADKPVNDAANYCIIE
jgi:hypothetical protein